VDDVRIVRAGLDVGWREDPDRVVRELGRPQAALHFKGLFDVDGGLLRAVQVRDRFGFELVRDHVQGTIHGCRKVAFQEEREGE
jgi:hypothetical protein